jgi:putative membrane protein
MFKRLFTINPPAMRHRGAAILAGALGGLFSTWFKFGWDVFWPPRIAGRIPEPEVLVSMFTHHPTSLNTSHLISFAFCIVFGMAYGILVEYLPIVSLGTGLAFGFAIWAGAHEVIMPWLGLTPPTWDLPANEQFAEMFGHAFWGLIIGVFYENFRRRWARPIMAASDSSAKPLPSAAENWATPLTATPESVRS